MGRGGGRGYFRVSFRYMLFTIITKYEVYFYFYFFVISIIKFAFRVKQRREKDNPVLYYFITLLLCTGGLDGAPISIFDLGRGPMLL